MAFTLFYCAVDVTFFVVCLFCSALKDYKSFMLSGFSFSFCIVKNLLFVVVAVFATQMQQVQNTWYTTITQY